MTKKELDVLESMLHDPDVKGHKYIRRIIWLNTTFPKYEIGECFEVTDPGHRVYGVSVNRFRARVTKIMTNQLFGNVYRYELVAHVRCGSKELDTKIYKNENDIGRKVSDNLNVIHGDENEFCDSTSL